MSSIRLFMWSNTWCLVLLNILINIRVSLLFSKLVFIFFVLTIVGFYGLVGHWGWTIISFSIFESSKLWEFWFWWSLFVRFKIGWIVLCWCWYNRFDLLHISCKCYSFFIVLITCCSLFKLRLCFPKLIDFIFAYTWCGLLWMLCFFCYFFSEKSSWLRWFPKDDSLFSPIANLCLVMWTTWNISFLLLFNICKGFDRVLAGLSKPWLLP